MFEIGKLTRLPLGYVGESNSRTISIDVNEWLKEFPDALVMIQVVRPVDRYKYPAAYTMQEGVIHWTVDGAELIHAGKGLAQISLYDPDTKREYKSRVVGTVVAESLDGFNGIELEDGDPANKWVNQVLTAAENAENAAIHAAESETNTKDAEYNALETLKSAGDKQVNRITTEGERTLASIPTEYASLSSSVDALKAVSKAKSSLLGVMTNGHFDAVEYSQTSSMHTYNDKTGEIVESTSYAGSEYIKCPKNLCLSFGDTSARFYLYFYALEDGEFVPNWSIVNTSSSTGAKNYLNPESIPYNMLTIPDGVYMRIAVRSGEVSLYEWDGEPFGPSLSADTSTPTSGGEVNPFPVGGSSGLTIPGESRYVVTRNAHIYALHGVKDDTVTTIRVPSTRFAVLPNGYDYFRARLYFDDETRNAATITGDVSEYVSAAAPYSENSAAARAKKVLGNCRKACDLRWRAAQDLLVQSTSTRAFKAGVEYNGIPYASDWMSAHYIGWHVSPHTFANAANDDQSVFYTKKAVNSAGVEVPWYSTVCSAFATMCDGWPYPQTNAGFIYDPMVSIAFTADPPLGTIYSNIQTHCVIPNRVVEFHDGNDAVRVFEAVTPLCALNNRYGNISTGTDESGYHVAALDGYMDDYGYAVHNLGASANMIAPYSDFDDVEIVGGSARPDKGDKSVYTSDDMYVYINIKDNAAKTLYITNPAGSTKAIPINEAEKIDVRDQIIGDGIYQVYTDVSNEKESFEYHNVFAVPYTIKNGVISFARNDFWYAACYLRGSDHFPGGNVCCVPANANGDYSAWSKDGHYITSAHSLFYKGEYGAYTVRAVKA